MEHRFTYGQRLALGIIAAHNIGIEVGMLEEAEDIISGKDIEPCKILCFEQCFMDAHKEIAKGGQPKCDLANAEIRNIIKKLK